MQDCFGLWLGKEQGKVGGPGNFVAALSERNEINFVFLPDVLISGVSRHSCFFHVSINQLKATHLLSL